MKLPGLPLPALLFTLLALPRLTAFEGDLVLELKEGRERPITVRMSVKPGYQRIEMPQADGETVVSLVDQAKREVTVLMPEERMYMKSSIPEPEEAKAEGKRAQVLKDTGMTETILGYTCRKYQGETVEGLAEVWCAEGLGFFGGLSHSDQPKAGWESALSDAGLFPLRTIISKKQKQVFRMDVRSIEAKALPEAHFRPPPGYRPLSMTFGADETADEEPAAAEAQAEKSPKKTGFKDLLKKIPIRP